jgi:hypothetical protein
MRLCLGTRLTRLAEALAYLDSYPRDSLQESLR